MLPDISFIMNEAMLYLVVLFSPQVKRIFQLMEYSSKDTIYVIIRLGWMVPAHSVKNPQHLSPVPTVWRNPQHLSPVPTVWRTHSTSALCPPCEEPTAPQPCAHRVKNPKHLSPVCSCAHRVKNPQHLSPVCFCTHRVKNPKHLSPVCSCTHHVKNPQHLSPVRFSQWHKLLNADCWEVASVGRANTNHADVTIGGARTVNTITFRYIFGTAVGNRNANISTFFLIDHRECCLLCQCLNLHLKKASSTRKCLHELFIKHYAEFISTQKFHEAFMNAL